MKNGNSTLKMANQYLMPNYGPFGLEITSGNGVYALTRGEDGEKKECLDFLCGLGVTALGYRHPAVMNAIIKTLNQGLAHVSNLYATRPMAKLAKTLSILSGFPGARIFFCNSGTEANEAAGKLARIWAYENFGPESEKNEIIALHNGFHGRTFLSISMTGQPKMQEKFAPGVPGIKFVKLNDVAELRAAANERTCAIIFETIQAEGGINLMSREFYGEIETLSKKYHFLRIADEVQTGIGRTGEMFCFKHFEHQPETGPEIITLAKALGGGILPMGAIIAKKDVAKYLLRGSHAATFGGNPIVCAASLAMLKAIKTRDLLKNARETGAYFLNLLKGVTLRHEKIIKEARGLGLMVGVELYEGYSAGEVAEKMKKGGILVGVAGPQVVRFLPPLIAETKHIKEAVGVFEKVIDNLDLMRVVKLTCIDGTSECKPVGDAKCAGCGG